MNIDLESEYLERLGKGDHKAFDALFMYYYPKVKFFLAGFIKNESEACDIAQDVFFKVWTHRETIANVTSFNAYLIRMTRNLIYDYFQHNQIKEMYNQKQMEVSSYTDLIEEELYAKELLLLIDIAIEKMPEQRRRVFVLSRKKGLTNEEIATCLSINKRTVENHITQALSDIRKVILMAAIFFI